MADGLRWALAGVLVLQTFLGGLAPTVLGAFSALLQTRRAGAPLDLVALVSSAIPWLVFLGAHLSHVRFLRRLAPFPYSDGQVALMALLPGYNLYGSVELFTAQGEAMERLGGRAGLALELRASAAMASALAVAVAVLVAGRFGAHLEHPPLGPDSVPPALARSFLVLSLALLLVRLYALARLQIATRDLVRAQRAGPLPAAEPVRQAPGLPGARVSIAVGALALAAIGSAVTMPLLTAPPDPAPVAIFRRAPLAAAKTAPAEPRAMAVETAPTRAPPPAPPVGLPPGYLMGGRAIDWWRGRLRELVARSDEPGRRLLELTRERALANGLLITERGGELRVEPGPELIAAARAEAIRAEEDR